MIFLIDLGNTQLTIAGWQDGRAAFSARIATDRLQNEDHYEKAFRHILKSEGSPVLTGCALSSVVPALTVPVAQAMRRVTGFEPVILSSEAGLGFQVLTREAVGADMLAGAEAIKEKLPLPAIAVDMGTATTFCCQNKAGDVLGVAIAPGVALGVEALFGRASHLCSTALEAPAKAIGTDTGESIRSGVILGAASLVDGMYRRMAAEMDPAEGKPTLVLTGGLSHLVAPFCEENAQCHSSLLLEGLAIYYERNKH